MSFWDNIRHFKEEEFNCAVSGENRMEPEFIELLDVLRDCLGFPLVITSGYRSPQHPVESRKTRPGTHTQGIAADIKVRGSRERYLVTTKAIALGFTGIGIGDGFVHVDTRAGKPLMWTYY